MDLSIFLEATQSIVVPFAGDTVKLEMYSAGPNRLAKEQRLPLLALADGDETTGSNGYANSIEYSRLALPLLVKSWDLLWRGAPLPLVDVNAMDPIADAIEAARSESKDDEVVRLQRLSDQGVTEVRRYPLPDDLLFAIGAAMREAVAANPTTPQESRSTSEPAANATEPMASN